MPTLMMLILLRIKSEMDDFRDNLSDLGRDDDLRWMITRVRCFLFIDDEFDLHNI